ncbi:tetratricopeptide repeat protein [Nodosilinea sp. PGN35]|uniref:tetratricopeptide repeat protein n=1 Tax=Nodosilinea sp. PGN35 TaxID=3020489 RepID=UPI0023B29E8A|nr:tetratricopeptide repeat protein [Nodosilinea sp. TSF1-S3]MDF0365638.1 tetratricopeptide repeat protein [Nodosilinea sp. TSF1-S3]
MPFKKLFGRSQPPESSPTPPPSLAEQVISPWEAQNEGTIARLARFIDFAKGFTLGFVEISFPEDLDDLLKVLKKRPECRLVDFQVFDFSDPNLTYLQDALKQRIDQLPQSISALMTPKRVILVKGLENSIGLFGDYPPVLQDLNFVRDALADSVPYPVLFCLPSYAINRVIKFAPDFWSWKSGVFRLLASHDSQDEASIYALHAQKMLGNASQLEKQERIRLLEKLAQEFDPLAANRSKADLRIAAQALVELGIVHISSGEFLKAQAVLEPIAQIFEKPGWQLEAKSDLAIYIKYLIWRGHLDVVLGNTAKAEQRLGTALALNNDVSPILKATSYCYLGSIKAQQDQIEEAIWLFQQSLKIEERIGDAQGQAATLHEIAKIKALQNNIEEAIALFNQSLNIKEYIGDALGKAATLHEIARIKAQQNNVEEAILLFHQSLEIFERIGNAHGKAVTLNEIAKIKGQQGNAKEAITLFHLALEILQRIGSQDAATSQAWLEQVQQTATLSD